MAFDDGHHEAVLMSVARQLTVLLDETAGMTGPNEPLYRVSLHEAKSAVKQALTALERLRA